MLVVMYFCGGLAFLLIAFFVSLFVFRRWMVKSTKVQTDVQVQNYAMQTTEGDYPDSEINHPNSH